RSVPLVPRPGRSARHVLAHGGRIFLTFGPATLRFMNHTVDDGIAHLLHRLNEVMQRLDRHAPALNDPNTRFADALDSMAMVEFLAVLAEYCGVTIEAIEESVGRRF